MRMFAIVLVIWVAACSNEPVKVGQDTYLVTAMISNHGSTDLVLSEAKTHALAQANSYCASLHKEMMLLNQAGDMCLEHFSCSELTVRFMCLDKTDPRYKPNDVSSTR
jgi:hypothetical protein